MALVTLLRHGQTDANANGLLQGRSDNPLNETGQLQAAAAAAALTDVDRVIASPLLRTRQTASHLAQPVEEDERWIELDYGDWEGIRVDDLSPETWKHWRAELTLRPPNGETLLEVGVRVRDAMDELVTSEMADHTVIVSHMSPIKAAVAWSLGVGDEVGWRTRLSTGSYSQLEVEVDSRRRALVSFNVVATG